ncbi:MAG: oxidoreductase [Thiotrichales bacterium]|nr:oxidoreductase [Thiotrichales bacterium]|tara:strand:- start:74 stop:1252 length:1179 start_codon:yes stop_codon:yes gene_type:complete
MSKVFSNWSGLVRSKPAEVRSIRNIADAQAAVAEANSRGCCIRVAGTTHSHYPLVHADDGLILRTDEWCGAPKVDAGGSSATLVAGTKLKAIGEPLWEAGFSLANQGDIDVQSIAGLIGTGVHGTGRAQRSISDAVCGVSLVSAEGDVVTTQGQPELLEALRLNLGAFGIVTEVSLRLLPAYYLHEHSWLEPVPAIMERIDQLTTATRHFEFFWRPDSDLALAKALHPHPGAVDDMPAHEGQYVDRAYRVFPSVRENKHTEMEYSVPAAEGPACFARLRELMRTRFPEVTWAVEYRTLAADDGWISTARGRDTVTISIHQAFDQPYEAFFRASEILFREHAGRPHWGKMHYLSANELADEHPGTWERFWRAQTELDPRGLFLNPYLRRIAGR